MRYLTFLSLFLCVLSGCAVIDHHGHELTPEQVKSIQVGVTTKEQLAKSLGTPSAVSPFNNSAWFYMSKVTSTRSFLTPVVLKSQITRIEFNDKGVVKCLDSLTEADEKVIAHIRRTTPTAGHDFGVVEQIFGNFGKFNGKDPDMGRRGP